MRRVIVVEVDAEIGKVAQDFFGDSFGQLFRRCFEFSRLEHDGRAVDVAGAHIGAGVTAKFLKTYPYVALQVLDQVPHMN